MWQSRVSPKLTTGSACFEAAPPVDNPGKTGSPKLYRKPGAHNQADFGNRTRNTPELLRETAEEVDVRLFKPLRTSRCVSRLGSM